MRSTEFVKRILLELCFHTNSLSQRNLITGITWISAQVYVGIFKETIHGHQIIHPITKSYGLAAADCSSVRVTNNSNINTLLFQNALM